MKALCWVGGAAVGKEFSKSLRIEDEATGLLRESAKLVSSGHAGLETARRLLALLAGQVLFHVASSRVRRGRPIGGYRDVRMGLSNGVLFHLWRTAS